MIKYARSDTAALLRTAAIVRHRRHVRNRRDANTQSTQGTNRRFATWTWPFDFNIQIFDPLFHGSATCHFRGNLSSKRSRLARTLKALTTRRRPRQSIALTIGNRDDGVIEGRMHVGDTVRNVLADLLAHALCGVIGGRLSHTVLSSLFLQCRCALARPFAGACIGAGTLTTHWQSATMTETTITTNVHQALDVHRRLSTQITFDSELCDLVTNFFQIGIGQFLDLFGISNATCFADFASTGTPNAINSRQANFGMLMGRNIDTSDTSHVRPLTILSDQPWRCL